MKATKFLEHCAHWQPKGQVPLRTWIRLVVYKPVLKLLLSVDDMDNEI